jgi:glycosyltransferase involved in cell wall biosynthesis
LSEVPFTFGIITVYEDKARLQEIILSIRNLNIPEYEIIFVGGGDSSGIEGEDIRIIDFDENEKPKWITRKKNIIVQNAKYDNVVLMHDYHIFDPCWYEAFKTFGIDWDICSCPQYLINGSRNPMDWSLWDKPGYGRAWSLNYDDWSQTQYMYISGGFFMVKKNVMLDEPLDESRVWNEEEDVEWSMRVRNKYVMKCNGNAIVRHNKWHRHAGPQQ